jgi:hypothetical protein
MTPAAMYLDVPDRAEWLEYGAYANDWWLWTVRPGRYPLQPVTIDSRPADWTQPYYVAAEVAVQLQQSARCAGEPVDPTTRTVQWHWFPTLLGDGVTALWRDAPDASLTPAAWFREGDFLTGGVARKPAETRHRQPWTR